MLSAVQIAGVPALVYASSVGAYQPGPKWPAVDETWPATGVKGSQYSEQKAEVERLVDRFEADNPGVRVVRMRPGVVLSALAAAEQVRYFVGPFLPRALLRPGLVPVVPATRQLVFQIVHSEDVARAYAAAVRLPVHGAFNIAAEPVSASCPRRCGGSARAATAGSEGERVCPGGTGEAVRHVGAAATMRGPVRPGRDARRRRPVQPRPRAGAPAARGSEGGCPAPCGGCPHRRHLQPEWGGPGIAEHGRRGRGQCPGAGAGRPARAVPLLRAWARRRLPVPQTRSRVGACGGAGTGHPSSRVRRHRRHRH